MKITALVLSALLLLSCVGCAPELDEHFSIDFVQQQLQDICEEKERITLYQLSGTFSKNVWADEAFIDALGIARWEPTDIDYQSEEYRKQERHTMALAYTEDGRYELSIGMRYGVVVRIENKTEVTDEGTLAWDEYHSSQCFLLGQSEEGECVEAIDRLIEEYIAQTGDEGCNL